MELVSASGEAYNSRYPVGKADLDMSIVGEPNLESHVFHGFGSSPASFGQDFRSRSSLRAMFKLCFAPWPGRGHGAPHFYLNIARRVDNEIKQIV